MSALTLQTPTLLDEEIFLAAMQGSQKLHHPWVHPPLTSEEFSIYFARYQQSNAQSFWLRNHKQQILGVFNLNEIVRGAFQSAYLGFYSVSNYAGQGFMSQGIKLLLNKVFLALKLHRIEANIQPTNLPSIFLVKKNGFRKEGFSPHYLNINGEWRDHERFAMTYEDWLKLNREQT